MMVEEKIMRFFEENGIEMYNSFPKDKTAIKVEAEEYHFDVIQIIDDSEVQDSINLTEAIKGYPNDVETAWERFEKIFLAIKDAYPAERKWAVKRTIFTAFDGILS